MRIIILFIAILLLLVETGGKGTRMRTSALVSAETVSSAATAPVRVDFDAQIKPILSKCTPCHFSGGQMYERLPFDRAETVRKLGTKLFTRIKNEDERQLIRQFLAQ